MQLSIIFTATIIKNEREKISIIVIIKEIFDLLSTNIIVINSLPFYLKKRTYYLKGIDPLNVYPVIFM